MATPARVIEEILTQLQTERVENTSRWRKPAQLEHLFENVLHVPESTTNPKNTILCIGCGTGELARFISRINRNDKVVGLDGQKLVETARATEGPDTNVTYLSYWENFRIRAPHVVAGFSFAYVQHRQQAIYDLFNMVEDYGRATLYFPLQSECFDWLQDIQKNIDDIPLYRNLLRHVHVKLPCSHFDKDFGYLDALCVMLVNAGFKIIKISLEVLEYHFESDEDMTNIAKANPYSKHLSEDLRANFDSMALSHLLRRVTERGKRVFVEQYAYAVVEKPYRIFSNLW